MVIGTINSGGNKGNTVNVGDIGGGGGSGSGGGGSNCGPVYIDGGTVDNSTNINIDAGGGTAIADASGGSNNLATTNGDDKGGRGLGAPIRSRYGLGGGNGGGGGNIASAGNGGLANASADGGIVVINEINSGGNEGNSVNVGNICAGQEAPANVPAAPAKPAKPGKTVALAAPRAPAGKGGGKVKVTKVPSTGVGHVPSAPAPVQTSPTAVMPAGRSR